MIENMDPNSWKYRIAEQIVASYKKDCVMSQHIFENVIIKELLWHATTMIKGEKVNRAGSHTGVEGMVEIKYVGQRYWSQEAINKYLDNNDGKGYKNCKGLIHEHAVPRKMIKEKIENTLKIFDKKTEEDKKEAVYNILIKYSKSIIITKEENKLIPNKDKFTKWHKITDGFAEAFKEEDFVNFIKEERYSNNIEIVDLYNHLDKNDRIVPYNNKFKDIMHNIKEKI
jgi:hypothetical protein